MSDILEDLPEPKAPSCSHDHDHEPREDDQGTVEFPARAMNGDWKLHRRWDRAGRLLGEDSMQTLANKHVVVFGLGGVGSSRRKRLRAQALAS
ncbi:MAG: hypothetical protein R3E66_20125 [bacterium]